MFIEISPLIFEGTASQQMLQHMFEFDSEKFTVWTWFLVEKILRPVIVYFALICLLRIFGKRELGQLNPFDLVVILSLSNTVQNAIIGEDNSLVGGIVGACALLGINYLMAIFKYNSKFVENAVEGKARTIIENSKINKEVVRSELLTESDLETIAHREGLDSAKDIEKCVIDPNGGFLVEGNTPTSDEHFRTEVLSKLEELTKQLKELKAAS